MSAGTRKVPKWMEPEVSIAGAKLKNCSSRITLKPKETRVTRSRTKSLGGPEKPPEEKNPLYDNIERPPFEYKGKIVYILTFIECAEICDWLMRKIPSSQEYLVLGFDLEWPFSFQTGPGKVALMQICADLNEVFLFQISEFGHKIPAALVQLISHPKVRIAGVNIRNDIHKLCRDFSNIDKEPILLNCIDARTQANEVLTFRHTWSMEKLILYCFKLQINKSGKVRMSKWHESPLSADQQLYAATDAYGSLLLHNHFRDLKLKQICENIQQNITKYLVVDPGNLNYNRKVPQDSDGLQTENYPLFAD